MRPLSIAFPYFENAGILRKHLETWLKYPEPIRRTMVVTIADDGSPTAPAADVIPADYPIDVRVYRVGVNLVWNQCGARNLAMHNAPDGWTLVTDADHVLEPDDCRKLLALKVRENCYYVPSRRRAVDRRRYHRHPNSYYLTKEMFWRTGGCDEDFQGTYGSDSTFRRAIEREGIRVETDIALTLYGREVIPDASTTAWGRKDSPYASHNNPILRAKRKGPAYRAENCLRFPWERVR